MLPELFSVLIFYSNLITFAVSVNCNQLNISNGQFCGTGKICCNNNCNAGIKCCNGNAVSGPICCNANGCNDPDAICCGNNCCNAGVTLCCGNNCCYGDATGCEGNNCKNDRVGQLCGGTTCTKKMCCGGKSCCDGKMCCGLNCCNGTMCCKGQCCYGTGCYGPGGSCSGELTNIDYTTLASTTMQQEPVYPCAMPAEGKRYQLMNKNFNCVMEIANVSPAPGANVITYYIWNILNWANQLWFIHKVPGTSYYVIVNGNSQLALDSTGPGSFVTQQVVTCNKNQQFSFEINSQCNFYLHSNPSSTNVVLTQNSQNPACTNVYATNLTDIFVTSQINNYDPQQTWTFNEMTQDTYGPIYPKCPSCASLPDPRNGYKSVDNSYLIPGTIATFTCVGEYYLNGSANLLCQDNGTWNASVPICQTYCSSQYAPDNGGIQITDGYFNSGTVVNFNCNKNYHLVGDERLLCQSNHEWNGTTPTCATFCYPNPCINQGVCIDHSYGYTCQCTPGYYGTNCSQINFCILGNFKNGRNRRKRQIPRLNELDLDNVIESVSNTTNGAAQFAAAVVNNVVDNTTSELTALTNVIRQFKLPTALPHADPCAPHGICVSGFKQAVCLCDAEYYGTYCRHYNCSIIDWTTASVWSKWSECYVKDCDKGVGIRNRTANDYNGCHGPTDHESCIPDGCDPKDPLTPTARIVATVAQSIGCAILLGFVGAVFILFAVFKIMSLERMLHMIQEIFLFIAHVGVMALMKRNFPNTKCAIVGIYLQFSFLANFTFLALESLQTFCILQNVLSSGGFFSWRTNLAIGLGFPFGITMFTSMTMFRSYKSLYSCWLNFGNKIAYATTVPVVALCLLTIVLTEAAAMGDVKKLPMLPQEKYIAANVNQKGSVLIIAFNILSWSFGAWALYAQKVELYGMVMAFNISLGVAVFMFHTLSDDQIARYLKLKICNKFK